MGDFLAECGCGERIYRAMMEEEMDLGLLLELDAGDLDDLNLTEHERARIVAGIRRRTGGGAAPAPAPAAPPAASSHDLFADRLPHDVEACLADLGEVVQSLYCIEELQPNLHTIWTLLAQRDSQR